MIADKAYVPDENRRVIALQKAQCVSLSKTSWKVKIAYDQQLNKERYVV